MKISFRIECPYCHWGHIWSDNFVNMGWLGLKCAHCESDFFTKIEVTGVSIQTNTKLPNGVPCANISK